MMRNRNPYWSVLMISAMLASSLWAAPFSFVQKKSDPKDDQQKKEKKAEDAKPPAKDGDAPKPLFEGKSGLKSSRQSKDTTTMGFNGLDPDGKVGAEFLSASANDLDLLDARSLIVYKPTPQELAKFLQDGQLKAKK